MDRRQLVIPDFQPAGLPDPRERPFDDPADLAQAAPVRRPLPRQVVLDPPLLEATSIARRAVLPVPVQRLRLPPGAAAPPADRRDVVHQAHRLERLVAVRPGEARGQRGAVAIDEQVPLGAFFGPVRGVFAGEYPPKTARKLWLSTQQCSQSMPFSRPTRCSRAWRSFFQTPPALPVPQPPPARHARAAAHLLREHLPGDATLEDEDDAGQAGPVIDGWPAALTGPGAVARQQRLDDLPQLIRHKRASHGAPS